jgi:hypothetical protein
MRFIAIAACMSSAILLSACGGGADAPSMPAPQAAVLPAAACDTAALSAGSAQLVGADCVRSSAVLAPARSAAAPLAAASLTASQLMDWAEATFPQLFPASGKADGVLTPYTYRYYPATGNYIGVTASEASPGVYLYGNIARWQIVRVGAMNDYLCNVTPSACTTLAVPGAPAISSAVAGNASATLNVTAPTSGGGSISRYDARCTANSALAGSGSSTGTSISVSGLVNGTAYACTVTASNATGTGAASAAATVTPSSTATGTTTTGSTGTSGGTTSSTSTAGVQCSYSYSALNTSASVNLTSTVSWSCSGSQRSMTGNGVPDHAVGTFPSANNPSTIKSLSVHAAMPLTPALAASTTTGIHVVGYVLNGVKMDPATAASCSVSGSSVTCTADGNTGIWSIEAMGQTVMNLGLDTNNAHVQPDGSYHYHGMPTGFITKLGKGQAMTLVGFALDGFPMYARYGYTTATSASSAIKVVSSSYRLKASADSGRPSTTSYPMGTFTQDYEYAAGSGDLDECNGRFGVTPEFPNGIYHYFVTDTWPYIGRCFKGTSTTPNGP